MWGFFSLEANPVPCLCGALLGKRGHYLLHVFSLNHWWEKLFCPHRPTVTDSKVSFGLLLQREDLQATVRMKERSKGPTNCLSLQTFNQLPPPAPLLPQRKSLLWTVVSFLWHAKSTISLAIYFQLPKFYWLLLRYRFLSSHLCGFAAFLLFYLFYLMQFGEQRQMYMFNPSARGTWAPGFALFTYW